MTYEELQQAIRETEMFLPDDHAERNTYAVDPWEQARHCQWMLQEILTWGPDRDQKAQRWLGFVQGWLWSQNLATVTALRAINQGPSPAATSPVASSGSPLPSVPTPT